MIKYIKIGFYFLKETFYYSYMIIIHNIHLLIFVLIIPLLVTYGVKSIGENSIAGIPIEMYARYIFVAELIMTNWNNRDMNREIKGGSIVTYLNKPISFIGYYFSQTFFKNLINIALVGVISGIITYIVLGGFPRFGVGKMILFLISMLIGIGMLSFVSLIISLFAFILEDSTFIRLSINKLYFIFGGVFFPIGIYPIRMQKISSLLPFQYYVYSPAKFFSTGDLNFLISYLPLQILRLILLAIIVKLIYKRMLRNVEINGG